MTGEIIILITASSEDEAEKIGSALVGERLAACVNIMPGVRSLFVWEGKTRDEREVLLICKSRRPLLERIVARVKSLHSYAVPEIIALPVIGGSAEYLSWMRDATKE
jgi:periplasmic divalent cation tolerance protein